jgi:hypothetical protein
VISSRGPGPVARRGKGPAEPRENLQEGMRLPGILISTAGCSWLNGTGSTACGTTLGSPSSSA